MSICEYGKYIRRFKEKALMFIRLITKSITYTIQKSITRDFKQKIEDKFEIFEIYVNIKNTNIRTLVEQVRAASAPFQKFINNNSLSLCSNFLKNQTQSSKLSKSLSLSLYKKLASWVQSFSSFNSPSSSPLFYFAFSNSSKAHQWCVSLLVLVPPIIPND